MSITRVAIGRDQEENLHMKWCEMGLLAARRADGQIELSYLHCTSSILWVKGAFHILNTEGSDWLSESHMAWILIGWNILSVIETGLIFSDRTIFYILLLFINQNQMVSYPIHLYT